MENFLTPPPPRGVRYLAHAARTFLSAVRGRRVRKIENFLPLPPPEGVGYLAHATRTFLSAVRGVGG